MCASDVVTGYCTGVSRHIINQADKVEPNYLRGVKIWLEHCHNKNFWIWWVVSREK